MDDIGQFVITVVLLALVAVATLVRKFIEKASAGEKGKKIDLGKAVHAQVQKYMKAFDRTALMPGQPPVATTAPEPGPPVAPLAPPTVAPPTRGRPPTVSRATPASRPRRAPLEIQRLVSRGRTLGERTPAALLARKTKFKIDRGEVRKAIIMAEVLGPPMALREKEYRLF